MSVVALIFVRSGLNLVVFGVIFAVLSYLRTSRFKQHTGVDPWHIPPPVWAILSFFIAIFGTLLSVIACATTRYPGKGTGAMFSGGPGRGPGYAPVPGPGYRPPPGYGAPGNPAPPGSGPNPGYGQFPGQSISPGAHPSAYPPFPAAPPPPEAAGPPAWHPDPSGRHQFRYWDGSHWTEHVSDSGTAGTDPV